VKNSTAATGRPENIAIWFGKSGERDAARYVSDTTVREEALDHGRLVALYWSASGQVQRESVTAQLPGIDPLKDPIHAFELEIDGQSLHNRWDWVGASERPGARPGTVEAVVELRHQVRPITLNVVTRLDGSPILARWLEITNTGAGPAALSHVSPWSGVLWGTQAASNPSVDEGGLESIHTLGYIRAEKWGEEGNLVWQPLPPEGFSIERTLGRSHGSPYFIVRNELTGELLFAGLAWSANWHAEFGFRRDTMLTFKMGPLGPGPLRVIAPGETVISPEVHLGIMHCDLDAAAREWHRHMRASVVPPRPEGKEMYTLAGRVVEEPGEWILREVDIAAEMGVEAFMVDAGWYGDEFGGWWERRGDWFEGSWLPGGMAGVRDYVHKRGMLFGLWHEAETLTAKSRLYTEHPEWVLTTDDGRNVGDLALNLAIPEAAQFVEDSVIRLIRDFKLDFYKLDYNISTLEGGQNLREGYAEHESWRHFEAIYRIYDRARREFPKVALENCASGGGRNDLGMLSRFHYACESDMSTFPLSIRAINTMTLFIPPEAICYYHNHISHAHQMADLDTHLRVTLFAVPIYVGFGAQDADRSTPYFAKTKRYVELAKSFCRPILADRCAVYHHTPDIGLLAPADWCVLEYAADNRSRGYAGVFRLSAAGPGDYNLRLRGVDASRDYDVTLDNSAQTFRISGRELVNSGLAIRLDAALTSELVMYQSAGSP